MSAPFATPSSSIPDPPSSAFPKSRRLLSSSEFRRVYDGGKRYNCIYFAAFCLRRPEQPDGPKAGFTVSRANGNSVVRNRLRRRVREAVRRHLYQLDAEWCIVFNPRRPALEAPAAVLEQEVVQLFLRCAKW